MITSFAMRNRRSAIAAAALASVLVMAALRAWTCDDAFITFRVVDQLLAGHGPVYNAGERVQVFTHPLWFLLLAAWSAAGASLFPGVMALSLGLFAAGLAMLWAAFRDKPVALAVVAVALLLSRTVTDFATGGLETALSFALFAAALHALRGGRGARAIGVLALLPLNRLDLLPWVLPFAWIAVRAPRHRALAALALAAPAAAWAIFSVVYYGAPLPNTALAKLGGGLLDRMDTGTAYLAASFLTDPGASALLLLGIAAFVRGLAGRAVLAAPDRRLLAAAATSAGIGVAYILWCGGDFMLGRFVLPILWALAAAILAAAPAQAATGPSPARPTGDAGRVPHAELRFAARAIALLGVLHLVLGKSATQLWLDLPLRDPLRNRSYAGAIDERRYYLPWLGAYSADGYSPRTMPRKRTASGTPEVMSQLGVMGYVASLDQPVEDFFALTDPLLARIAPLPDSRPGHAYRPMPAEFWRWSDPGHAFAEAGLDELAARLRLAHVERDLWSGERLRAIAWLASRRSIALPSVEVAEEGDSRRITVHPAPLFRFPYRPDRYLVQLRMYDDEGLALDGQCRVGRVPEGRDAATAIEIARGAILSLACPKSVTDREGIVMRVGAVVPEPGGPQLRYDEAIPIARPAFRWWARSVPGWLAEGWERAPAAPLAVGALLLAVALGLGRGARPSPPGERRL